MLIYFKWGLKPQDKALRLFLFWTNDIMYYYNNVIAQRGWDISDIAEGWQNPTMQPSRDGGKADFLGTSHMISVYRWYTIRNLYSVLGPCSGKGASKIIYWAIEMTGVSFVTHPKFLSNIPEFIWMRWLLVSSQMASRWALVVRAISHVIMGLELSGSPLVLCSITKSQR